MYKIYFSEMESTLVGRDEPVALEILPEKISSTCGREVKIHNMLGIGEVSIPGKRKLRTWQVNSVLEPDGEREVIFFKNLFEELCQNQKPFYLTIMRMNPDGTSAFGGDIPEQVLVILEDCNFEEREGEIGTLYYKVKLIEYIKFIIEPLGNTEFIHVVPERANKTGWSKE